MLSLPQQERPKMTFEPMVVEVPWVRFRTLALFFVNPTRYIFTTHQIVTGFEDKTKLIQVLPAIVPQREWHLYLVC